MFLDFPLVMSAAAPPLNVSSSNFNNILSIKWGLVGGFVYH